MELERLSSDAQLPLTPALSRGERERAYAALRAVWRTGAGGERRIEEEEEQEEEEEGRVTS